HRRDKRRDAGCEPVAGRPVAGVHAFDVERRQSLVDERRELRRERGLLDVVFALQKVDGIGAGRRDLLADLRGGPRQNASNIADTMLFAKSVLRRSRAFASWPKYAAGSTAPPVCVPVASYSCLNTRLGLSQRIM